MNSCCFLGFGRGFGGFSGARALKSVYSTTSRFLSGKSFKDIPGPRGYTVLNRLVKEIPLRHFCLPLGVSELDALHLAGFEKYRRFGKIVREAVLPGVNIVWLFDPDDIATVLNDHGSGNFPERRSHLALEKYRNDRPSIYRTPGLLPTNGSAWWKLRAQVQKNLSSPQIVKQFLAAVDEITREFLEKLDLDRAEEDFLPELSRLNLEIIGFLAFDTRLNSFSDEERVPESRSSRLIEAAEESNSCILPLDQNFPLFKLFETPLYRRFRKAQEFLEEVALEMVESKAAALRSERSLIAEYLRNENLEIRDIVGMASDFFLAGIDTTSYTTSFLLYHLSNNPTVQEKLFQESLRVLPEEDSQLSSAALQEIPFARAVLKESLRLNPVSVGVGRTLTTDTLLSGFLVPRGTIIVTQNQISCRLPIHFHQPECFLPERWLKSTRTVAPHPHLVLPFGHGMRSCIARRLAEQNMLLLMLRMVRKYKLVWKGAPKLDFVTKLVNKPSSAIKIHLIQRPRKLTAN
ncbi:cytochrome P450 302a1, mitochondrial [Phlebotomus argentipes]|uniref:cytochrome P450 302a1, mitochondrial n=1 Tax=Phlebotomus argentipes TaxID=94469 RepID=UPI0028937097|nr:cytochrome P450 302a1, mitochondrial [Phlebotomus argentipes]